MQKYFKKLYLVIWIILLVTCDSLIVDDNYMVENSLNRALSAIEFNTHYIDTELLYLPGESHGYPVIWNSSNSLILDSSGAVNRPSIGQGRREVYLTATVHESGVEASRDFIFYILPQGKSVEYLEIGHSLVKFTLERDQGKSYYYSETFPMEDISHDEIINQSRFLSLQIDLEVFVNFDSESGFRYIIVN